MGGLSSSSFHFRVRAYVPAWKLLPPERPMNCLGLIRVYGICLTEAYTPEKPSPEYSSNGQVSHIPYGGSHKLREPTYFHNTKVIFVGTPKKVPLMVERKNRISLDTPPYNHSF